MTLENEISNFRDFIKIQISRCKETIFHCGDLVDFDWAIVSLEEMEENIFKEIDRFADKINGV